MGLISANCAFQTPFFFLKPTSSYVFQGGSIEIPPPLDSVQYEVELGVVIGKEGRDISEANAFDYVAGPPLLGSRQSTYGWYYTYYHYHFLL